MKVILACTIRDFDVKDAYEEWDRRLGREDPGGILGGKRGVFGELLFLSRHYFHFEIHFFISLFFFKLKAGFGDVTFSDVGVWI